MTAPRDSLQWRESLRAIGERIARGVELSAFAVRMRNAFSEQSLRS